MSWHPAADIIDRALSEDLGEGDVTTDSLPALQGIERTAELRTRADCIVAGLDVAQAVFERIDATLHVERLLANGDAAPAGTALARVRGPMASILKAERTALNFAQHLCGIATETRHYVDAVAGLPVRIAHTRKTTPGLRLLEHQAVIAGGGAPHRVHLGSCAMLKDNHLQALDADPARAIARAVALLRQRISHTQKIEVEVESLAGVEAALSAGADIIMLDNMTPAIVTQAVSLIAGRATTEASGGITLDTVRAYGETGIDIISISRITLGARAIDIGLDLI